MTLPLHFRVHSETGGDHFLCRPKCRPTFETRQPTSFSRADAYTHRSRLPRVPCLSGPQCRRRLSAYAQGTGRVIGRVVEAEKGAPVAGAQIEVVEAAIRAVSAVDGRYTLSSVPAGPVSIRVRMIGYGPKTVTGVVVTADGTVSQDVSLAPKRCSSRRSRSPPGGAGHGEPRAGGAAERSSTS